MNSLIKVSRRFRLLFQFLFFLTPMMIGGYWIFAQVLPMSLSKMLFDQPQITITASTQVLGLGISILPMWVLMYCLHQLIHLFKNYEQGKIFILENVHRYRNLGFMILFWTAGRIAYHSLLTVVLTLNNPPGKRLLTVTIGSSELKTLLIGGLVILISWVMAEGYRLADEHAQTI